MEHRSGLSPAVEDVDDGVGNTARPVSGPRFGRAHAVVALLSIVTLAVTGAGWWMLGTAIGGFSLSSAIERAGGQRSSDGGENILLMGLDSRKDRNGQQLPAAVLSQLHAGDGSQGGYNTNTLIVVHLSADKSKAAAVSIPRDDYVPVTGIADNDHVKIKEAYGLAKAQAEASARADGVTDLAQLENMGREAGRTATIKTVEAFLQIPIDRFAEVSLVGFYDVAKALGGVTVCLNSAVRDSYSGARFPAGVQHLNATQALAFVRQRHGLDNGDLDRTHRQQAFLASVMHELQQDGTLSKAGTVQRLLAATKQDVVLSSGWDLVAFAQQMSDFRLGGLRFTTLPVRAYSTIDGQAVNLVDTAAVRAAVRQAFEFQTPAPATVGSRNTGSRAVPLGKPGVTGSAGRASVQVAADAPAPDTGTGVGAGGVPCVN
ncbi:Membrane-bound protein lytR (plasmid) [Tsukamurella tyrosinosolvens]|nr:MULTISPECIES: LCP family protein [Tsukamurella]SDQ50491.1 cell envelope-related function transcriptional attenuator common domain-containing protein [Tsukamurella pulmonis]SED54372.1 cell envelope-related function transcriptional attenuator common domain-containing protein [Tsukamurella tyrosinosolvens]SUP25249.1 Membrane-bound protein lytR [Tsukamurella pulmonis]VEI01640.1 Membrane-bound protein lytR [Tsukamurella tyrosinosolvens]